MLNALKEAKLPCSYPTLLAYEKIGVLLRPQGLVQYEKRVWRFYTQQEIMDNIERVRRYITAKKVK